MLLKASICCQSALRAGFGEVVPGLAARQRRAGGLQLVVTRQLVHDAFERPGDGVHFQTSIIQLRCLQSVTQSVR